MATIARAALLSPVDDVFGALGKEIEEAPPDVPAEAYLYNVIWKPLTLANDHEILKGASFDDIVTSDINAPC